MSFFYLFIFFGVKLEGIGMSIGWEGKTENCSVVYGRYKFIGTPKSLFQPP